MNRTSLCEISERMTSVERMMVVKMKRMFDDGNALVLTKASRVNGKLVVRRRGRP